MTMLTQTQLNRAVWGSGYGGRKHLVDVSHSRVTVPNAVGYHDEIRAQCSAAIYLAVVDTWEPDSASGDRLLKELKRRPPCVRCARLAEASGIAAA